VKAWVYREYGPPENLTFEDIETPRPGPDEVAIRVRASSLNAADWHIMLADPFLARLAVGLRRPRQRMVIGSDVAGVVDAVGNDVTGFSPGDLVYAETMMRGGCAEVVTVSADRVGHMPKGLSFEEAAAVPMAGVTALGGVRAGGDIDPGQTVLVNGASGGVGTFAVQLARALGGSVTAVCRTEAVDLVGSLGAVEVIDYTTEEAVDTGRKYDLVVNIGGTHSLKALRRTLTEHGTLAAVGGSQHGGLFGPGTVAIRGSLLSPFVSQRLVKVDGKGNTADLATLAGMIESGDVKPVIDRVFDLSDTPDAMRYLIDGHPKGKVVVTVSVDEL
jgi:NADPH:quinone reductase-like Zn-dependent oxidoreductase